MNEEQWKPHPEYNQIEVSNRGHVRNPATGHNLWWESTDGKNSHYHSVSVPGLKNKHERVHRLVYQTWVGEIPEGHDVCHRNGNRRDNRPENLYTATRSENKLLGPNLSHNRSGRRGVSYSKRDGNYRAVVTVNYKMIHIGHAQTAEEAAEMRDDWIMDRYGDKAHPGALNFPDRYFTAAELEEAGWKPVDYRQLEEVPRVNKAEINRKRKGGRS